MYDDAKFFRLGYRKETYFLCLSVNFTSTAELRYVEVVGTQKNTST